MYERLAMFFLVVAIVLMLSFIGMTMLDAPSSDGPSMEPLESGAGGILH
jgi:hypothetical protein